MARATGYIALGFANLQVCTAAMVHGFRIVEEMIAGLQLWMEDRFGGGCKVAASKALTGLRSSVVSCTTSSNEMFHSCFNQPFLAETHHRSSTFAVSAAAGAIALCRDR